MTHEFFPQDRETPLEGPIIKAISYLFQPTNWKGLQRPESPELLRGDPELFSKLVLRSTFKQPYCAGVLAFTESVKVLSERTQSLIMDSWEESLFPGLDERARMVVWVRHVTSNGFELHFVALAEDLLTGKSYTPSVAERDKYRLHLWTGYINCALGLSSPWEPERMRDYRPPGRLQKTEKGAMYIRAYSIAEELVNSGTAQSRSDLLAALPASGVKVVSSEVKGIRVLFGEELMFLRAWILSEDFVDLEALKVHRQERRRESEQWRDPAWIFPRLVDRSIRRLSGHLHRHEKSGNLLSAKVKSDSRKKGDPDHTYDPRVLSDPKLLALLPQFFPSLIILNELATPDRNPHAPLGRGAITRNNSSDVPEPSGTYSRNAEPAHRTSGTPNRDSEAGDGALLIKQLSAQIDGFIDAIRILGNQSEGPGGPRLFARKEHEGVDRPEVWNTGFHEAIGRISQEHERATATYGSIAETVRRVEQAIEKGLIAMLTKVISARNKKKQPKKDLELEP